MNLSNLTKLSNLIMDKFDVLCEYFNLEVYEVSFSYTGWCPIHRGDNISALTITSQGQYRGMWNCWTRKCHECFAPNMVGFIQGLLSQQNNWANPDDDKVSWQNTLEFISTFLKVDMHSLLEEVDGEHNNNNKNFVNMISSFNKGQLETLPTGKVMTQKDMQSVLIIPCRYFVARGYSEDILRKYDVGYYNGKDKTMYTRAIVPIYDNEYRYVIGWTGRSLNNEKPKWRHNKGLKTGNMLYNYWFAKKYIKEKKEVILVESPGNVWKLEECGIKNSLAIFGSSFSDTQRLLLGQLGILSIIISTDGDKAGEKAANTIQRKCERLYNVRICRPEKGDISDLSVEEVRELFNKGTI